MEYEAESNEKQNNGKDEQDTKYQRLMEDHEELLEKHARLEDSFTVLDDQLRESCEKLDSLEESMKCLQK